jgi:hypothetical protein
MSDDYASAKIKFRRKPATNKSWEYKQWVFPLLITIDDNDNIIVTLLL